MSNPSAVKKRTLRSSDNEIFEVEEAVAFMSITIKHLIEDNYDANNAIPLPIVTGETLAKVIEYCRKHVDEPENYDYRPKPDAPWNDHVALRQWDEEFAKVDHNTLFDLIEAANYLNIEGLLDLTCATVADMMRGKKPEEIRDMFHIKNDYTPEEEAQVRHENQWAFDD